MTLAEMKRKIDAAIEKYGEDVVVFADTGGTEFFPAEDFETVAVRVVDHEDEEDFDEATGKWVPRKRYLYTSKPHHYERTEEIVILQ